MKVYGMPTHLSYEPDYRNYNHAVATEREETAITKLKAWLIAEGYTGPETGEIAAFGVADGYARYMFADGGRRSCLIHLPFGDAWDYPYIERLTKADILQNIQRSKNMRALFGRK